ncbi:hypothetical protein FNV43_RR02118 [Rhamnella rubrinervis]|uniref:Uncharacterized protein n=1 Tax=Rhamnella rubrinervis TaxID=2594499 RepID=A0A8K0MTV1_9ROSA|nr:hypothetical protein FNV43_RR02118 [Rhamnella rubrinervis]
MRCSVFCMFAELDMWCMTRKTTILKILGGKHTVEPHMVHVLSRLAFHDTTLTTSGDICYLRGEWRQNVAFAGFEVPVQMDISAEKMIFGVGWIDPQRSDELSKVLDINLSWRLHKVPGANLHGSPQAV